MNGKTSHYVRQIADRLGLQDWTVVVSDEPCDETHDASVRIKPGQRHATVFLEGDYHETPRDELRHTIVHELLHCHFHEPQAAIERNCELLGYAGAIVLRREHLNWLEHGVDATAVAVARLLPLPPKVDRP